MKKTFILLLLISSILSLSAETNSSIREDATQTVRLSVTTYNTVYLGVSKNEVNSSIVPPSITETTFSYNPRTMNWETDSFFFYVISFVTQPLKITLTPSVLKESGGTTLDWRNTSSDFGSLSSSSMYTKDENGEQTIKVLEKKTGEWNYTSPRVYSWEMKLVVDGNKEVKAAKYSGTFILEVATNT